MTRPRTVTRSVFGQHHFRPWSGFWRRSIVRRGGLLFAFALAIITLAPSSSAEFESPFIEPSNGVTNAEFRGVWAFDRGYDGSAVGVKPYTPYERYESFAVGVDASITGNPCSGGTAAVNCNGILYFYNGSIWSRVLKPFSGASEVFSLNAIAGQIDKREGTLSQLWAVGVSGKVARLTVSYYGTIGNPGSQLNYLSTYSDEAGGSKRDFYAVDAYQEYGGRVIAGGQAGLAAYWDGSKFTNFVPSAVPLSTPPSAAESVTGVKFVDSVTAYVTTSTFPIDPVSGKRRSPYEHNCPNLGASQAYLYKVDYSSNVGIWTNVADPSGHGSTNCFYGLANATKTDLSTVLWIASEKGVYRYDTLAGTWTTAGTGTVGKPYYSVVAINQRIGSGTNLLNNGDFESGTIDGWYGLGQDVPTARYFKDPNGIPVGKCTADTIPAELTIMPNDILFNHGKYLRVTDRAIYNTSSCLNTNKYSTLYTTGVTQAIPFTTIEGQRYKISGFYKVEFPSNASDLNYVIHTQNAQGGVVLACDGSSVQNLVLSVDCSASYRKLLRLKTQGDTTLIQGNVNGWVYFEMIISREDGIFENIIKSSVGVRLTKRKLDLRVHCEATYGATVSCDDLKVVAIDEPLTQSLVGVTVIAAGKDLGTNNIAINDDAITSNTYVVEALPAKIRADKAIPPPNTFDTDINSMFALGSQHIFAVGKGYVDTAPTAALGLAIYNRTPSTLRGSIWAGATSLTGSGTSSAIGPISVSCVDDRGQSGSQPSLCQRVPESYGISLEITSPYNQTKTGRLTGRGWFGKTADDRESLNLGRCLGSVDPDPAKGPLQSNFVAYSTLTNNSICDIFLRRCKGLDLDGNVTGNTNIACVTNFDCLGRCEKDRGFVCLKDDDCRLGPNSYADPTWANDVDNRFDIQPAARLTCGAFTNNILASPLACRPMGWLSFNPSDFSAAASTPPGGGTIGVQFNTLYTGHNNLINIQNQGAHELSGWGRFMTMVNSIPANGGWVKFRGPGGLPPVSASIPSAAVPDSLFGCYNCAEKTGVLGDRMNCAFCQDAAGQSCIPTDTTVISPPKPDSACYNVCKKDLSTHCASTADCGVNGPCITPGVCANPKGAGSHTLCTSNSACTTSGETCVIGAICKSAGSSCAQYGVNLDTTTGLFKGYAWSEDFGWLDFSQVNYGGSRILQTKLGDIYATGQIGDSTIPVPPGGTSCNATYLITSASTITGFCSALLPTQLPAGLSPIQPNTTSIPLLSVENSFQNILGRFDLAGMEKDVGGGKNKYGSNIITLTSSAVAPVGSLTSAGGSTDFDGALGLNNVPLPSIGQVYLNGQVYTTVPASGPVNPVKEYSIDEVINFQNAPATKSGAGILIVNGNLTINKDLDYPTLPALSGDARQLAAFTIVVRGNLTIDNRVGNLVGAYYVTGTINTATDEPSTNLYPLTVHGLMIAKEFNFGRKFAGTIENPAPSELIIYDGHLQSNPLPGMIDFASALPNSVTSP